MQANLLIARITFRAASTAADERYSYAVTHLPVVHIFTHGLHDARKLMPGNMRQIDVAVVAHPSMPIAAAHTCGLDL